MVKEFCRFGVILAMDYHEIWLLVYHHVVLADTVRGEKE